MSSRSRLRFVRSACAAVLVVAGLAHCGSANGTGATTGAGGSAGGAIASTGIGGSSATTSGASSSGAAGAGPAGGSAGSSDIGGAGGRGGSAGQDAAIDGPTDGGSTSDAGPAAANSDAPNDGPVTCGIGEIASAATVNDISLFGTPVYFNSGNPVPAGVYEVSYVDGCMKYSGVQGWAVNAYDGGCCSWWVIGETTAYKKLVPPGNIGFELGAGGFASFEDCVTASKTSAPKRFVHGGGKLGIWLQDAPYEDNVPGMDGRNPKWRLVRLGECVDGGNPDNSAGP